nr:ribonuclease H-like domain-containing protein [Tanacetum cinerariifolium]
MEKTRNKPKELLPYRMLLSRLFKNVMSIFPELTTDNYLSFDHVMHPFAPHYEQNTRSDHDKKRPQDITKEELITQKEDMEPKSTQFSTIGKLPFLKQGDYEMWRLRIEIYFQIQEYALWDVIKNGNSFKPLAETTTDDAGTSTTIIPGHVTIKEKAKKNNDVKARSTESLDLIFNRLQKLVSQLAVLGVFFSQEDLNLKFLRSIPFEWNTHVFWHTASVRTLDNGEIELNATVDGHNKTITEASVRRYLKLADADGISTLSTTEIFEQLALMGYVTDSNKLTFQKDEAITKETHDGLGKATTTASSLASEQGNGNISKTQTKATTYGLSSPKTSSKGGPECHFTIGDSPVQARPERLSNFPNEPPLGEDKVTHLDNELTSTKVVYNKALITLTKRVKKLEKKLKHKQRRAVIDSSEEKEASLDHEDSPKQERMIEEIDKDKNVNLVKSSEQGEAHETAKHRMDLSNASQINDNETLAETLLNIKRSAAKDKGIVIMQESESLKKIKKKEIMQISLDEEIAQRFYEEEKAQVLRDEGYAQQVRDQWITDETRLAQENLAQAEK